MLPRVNLLTWSKVTLGSLKPSWAPFSRGSSPCWAAPWCLCFPRRTEPFSTGRSGSPQESCLPLLTGRCWRPALRWQSLREATETTPTFRQWLVRKVMLCLFIFVLEFECSFNAKIFYCFKFKQKKVCKR